MDVMAVADGGMEQASTGAEEAEEAEEKRDVSTRVGPRKGECLSGQAKERRAGCGALFPMQS